MKLIDGIIAIAFIVFGITLLYADEFTAASIMIVASYVLIRDV